MDEISQNVRGEQEQENPGQNEGQGQNQGQGEGQNQGQNQFVIERSPSPDWEDADFNVNFEVDFTKKFLNVAKSYRVIPTRVSDDYSSEFEKLKSFLLPKIETYLEEELSIKLHLTLLCRFYKNNSNPIEFREFHLDQKSREVYQSTNVSELLDIMFDHFVKMVQVKLELSSDYVFDSLIHADVLFLEFRPVRGMKHIPLPSYLKKHSRYLTNIKNHDNDCLPLSIISQIYPQRKNKTRPGPYRKYMKKFNFTGLKSDYKSDADTIEHKNEKLSVNVYLPDEKNKGLVGFRYSKREKKPNNDIIEINLLLIHGEHENYHYVAINDLSGLVRSLHTKHHAVKDKDWYVCRYCLSSFSSKDKYLDHRDIFCNSLHSDGQVIQMPEEGSIYSFKNMRNEIPIVFIGSLDWETYQNPLLGCEPEPAPEDCKERLTYKWLKYRSEISI